MDFAHLCRICLESHKQTYDIYDNNSLKRNLSYSDMLSTCTKIKPCLNDGLPRNICKDCSRQLKKTFTFCIQCEKNDKKLRTYLVSKFENILVCTEDSTEIKNECQENDKDLNQKLENKPETKITVCQKNTEIKDENKDCVIQMDDIPSDRNNIAEKLKYTATVPTHNKRLGEIKLEPRYFDSDDSYWDDDDNNILKDIKIKNSDELILENIATEKKRGRKKKVLLQGEIPPVPESKLPHQCDICGKFLSNKSNLKAHKVCHTDLRPYKCSDCPASFRGHSALFQHKKVHSGETPYHCEYCPKQFSRRTGLVNHIRMHTGEKLYSCDICFKTFVQSAQLSIHMKRHKGEKTFLCQDCGKGFPIKADLKVHQRIHNGEKPYSCHLCTKTFATSGNLSIHIRIHNKVIRYNCKECQRGFVSCSSYKVHIKRHKGQKDYRCECGKMFYTSSALKQHKVVHTGEKKYQCKICERKFTQTSHLSRHFKRDHAKPNAPLPSSDHYKLVLQDGSYKDVFATIEPCTELPVKKIQIHNLRPEVKCEGS